MLPDFRGQLPKAGFFFRPQQNAGAQAIGLNQALHEVHLINANAEEKPRKLGKGFLAQGSSAVQIIAAWQVAVGEEGFVLAHIAGEPACNRPDRTGIKQVQQHRVRHEPRYAAVAVDKWMYP